MAFRQHFWALAVLLLFSLPAQAEPIQITSGFAEVRQNSGGAIEIAGASFSLLGGLSGSNPLPFFISPLGGTAVFQRSWSALM